jgi:hypothetical protein
MAWSDTWRGWRSSGVARHCGFLLGWLLILLSPAVGILPGPGGVFVFAGGAALVLKTSLRAKRWYVRTKRRWPKLGDWVDWGLRRKSARRRRELTKAAASPNARA